VVEASGTLSCKLEMLRLIMANGYVCGSMNQNICRLQHWVGEEAKFQFRLCRWVQGIGIVVQIEFTLQSMSGAVLEEAVMRDRREMRDEKKERKTKDQPSTVSSSRDNPWMLNNSRST